MSCLEDKWDSVRLQALHFGRYSEHYQYTSYTSYIIRAKKRHQETRKMSVKGVDVSFDGFAALFHSPQSCLVSNKTYAKLQCLENRWCCNSVGNCSTSSFCLAVPEASLRRPTAGYRRVRQTVHTNNFASLSTRFRSRGAAGVL